jgi:hypothetical protein
MRARIHLNLAEPKLAESAVKIQSPGGGWVTVAYAQEVLLDQAEPVVDHALREQVRLGNIKKVPHAFIEGELVAFRGRWRDKAPPGLKARVAGLQVKESLSNDRAERRQVGYNPRVAACFYATVPDHDPAKLTERFVRAARLQAVGWGFFAEGGTFAPLAPADRCAPADLRRTSAFEKEALAQGWDTTLKLMAPEPAATEVPPRRRRLR